MCSITSLPEDDIIVLTDLVRNMNKSLQESQEKLLTLPRVGSFLVEVPKSRAKVYIAQDTFNGFMTVKSVTLEEK